MRVWWGLSLDGGLRGVRGALSMAEGARREGLPRLLVPERDAPEAAAIGGVGSMECGASGRL